MHTLSDLFAAYKAQHGITTDAALANSLGVSHKAFSNYKVGLRRLPDVAIVRISDTLQIDGADVLTIVNANLRDLDQEQRGFWVERVCALCQVLRRAGRAFAASIGRRIQRT